jgi:hypothetical protein
MAARGIVRCSLLPAASHVPAHCGAPSAGDAAAAALPLTRATTCLPSLVAPGAPLLIMACTALTLFLATEPPSTSLGAATPVVAFAVSALAALPCSSSAGMSWTLPFAAALAPAAVVSGLCACAASAADTLATSVEGGRNGACCLAAADCLSTAFCSAAAAAACRAPADGLAGRGGAPAGGACIRLLSASCACTCFCFLVCCGCSCCRPRASACVTLPARRGAPAGADVDALAAASAASGAPGALGPAPTALPAATSSVPLSAASSGSSCQPGCDMPCAASPAAPLPTLSLPTLASCASSSLFACAMQRLASPAAASALTCSPLVARAARPIWCRPSADALLRAAALLKAARPSIALPEPQARTCAFRFANAEPVCAVALTRASGGAA